MDDRGNIYVADTINMAIRKISDDGNYNSFACVSALKNGILIKVFLFRSLNHRRWRKMERWI